MIWIKDNLRIDILIVVIFFTTSVTYGQIFKRLDNETADQFIIRIKPDSTELAHQVIQTKVWDPSNSMIIAFYKKKMIEDQSKYEVILAYLFIPSIPENHYTRTFIDTIMPEGGNPEIQSVFFANADTSHDKELAVLISWDQKHYDYKGKFYGTHFYKQPDLTTPTKRLTYLQEISEKFNECECTFNDGRKEKAKFITALQVKQELIRLGY